MRRIFVSNSRRTYQLVGSNRDFSSIEWRSWQDILFKKSVIAARRRGCNSTFTLITIYSYVPHYVDYSRRDPWLWPNTSQSSIVTRDNAPGYLYGAHLSTFYRCRKSAGDDPRIFRGLGEADLRFCLASTCIDMPLLSAILFFHQITASATKRCWRLACRLFPLHNPTNVFPFVSATLYFLVFLRAILPSSSNRKSYFYPRRIIPFR